MRRVQAGCIAVAIFEKRKLSAEAESLDGQGAITAALKCSDISGKPGSGLLLCNLPGLAAERVLLIGMGNGERLTAKAFREGLQVGVRLFATLGALDAVLDLPFDAVDQRDTAWCVAQVTQAAQQAGYRSELPFPLTSPAGHL
jgi:leucyl aminopeptidase